MRLLNSDSCSVKAEPIGAPGVDGHRLEHYAYVESLAREDAAAEKRTVRYQQRVGSLLPGGLMRRQAS